MRPWIDEAKTKCKDISQEVQRRFSDKRVDLRLAFVGYRDLCDGADSYVVHDFQDAASLEKRIAGVQEGGGGDAAEDIHGALDVALQLTWTEAPSGVARILVHIADAPCHNMGDQPPVHDLGSSSHADQFYDKHTGQTVERTDDVTGAIKQLPLTLELLMEDLAGFGIDVYFLELNRHTRKMTDRMKKAYHAYPRHGPHHFDVLPIAQEAGLLVKHVVDCASSSIRQALGTGTIRGHASAQTDKRVPISRKRVSASSCLGD